MVKPTTFDSIKVALATLTMSQREELIKWCKHLNKPSNNKSIDNQLDPHDWLADAIVRALIKRGLPYNLKAVVAKLPNYNNQSEHMRTFLIAAVKIKGTRRLQQLGDTAIFALIANLERLPNFRGIDAQFLMNNISQIPRALDGQFPGYLANGMLPMLIPPTKGT